MKFLISFFALFFLLNVAANSQELIGDSTDAIQKIVMGSGPITKEEYDGFWNGFNLSKEADKRHIIESMKGNFIFMQQYQMEIWSCAERSWINRKRDKCLGAKKILGKVKRANFDKQKVMIKSLETNMENLIKAAASRGEYRMEDGSKMMLTLEIIRATRSNIESMLKRFEQVLRVKY